MFRRGYLVFVLGALFLSSGEEALPLFDGKRAFHYLLRQCRFGPRAPGSEGHKRTLDFLVSELRKYADNVRLQNFPLYSPIEGRSFMLTNIIASFGDQKRRILLAAHWDTRPCADQDPDPKNRNRPILGANDGASGVAVLLEVARIIGSHPPKIGVDIVLFDGEDSGRGGYPEEFCQGSKYFAQNMGSDYHPEFGILLDMIGDRDLTIYVEEYSARYAPDIVDRVWSAAEELGIAEFDRRIGYEVVDDHLPLLKAGIKCIDLIDFDYPYWHTLGDTPDKCSPESLEKVGRVLLKVIYDMD